MRGRWCVFLLVLLAGLLPMRAAASDFFGNAVLQGVVDEFWSQYSSNRPCWAGGLAIFMITPQGRYFAGAGEDRTPQVAASHFRAASTTKTFTAAGILWLHQRGVLNIDDTLDGCFPGTDIPYVPATGDYDIPYKSRITIRQLLGHRAGVFDVSNDDIPKTAQAPYAGQRYTSYVTQTLGQPEHTFTFDELVGVVAANQLSYFEPGASYHYSNTGYSILGKIIQRASGVSHAQFMRERFLIPLALDHSSFPDRGDDRNLPEPYFNGYTFAEGQLVETTQDNMSANVAEGNLITTPEDLAEWAWLLYTGQAGLDPQTVSMMQRMQPNNSNGVYGLGCTFTQGLGYGHDGAHAGYLTTMRYTPDNQVAVVIMSSLLNFDDIQAEQEMLYQTARTAIALLVGNPPR